MSFINTLDSDFSNLKDIREKALNNFQSLGVPTPKHEEWKFTNIKRVFDVDYTKGASSTLSSDDIESVFIPSLEGNKIVFINGQYSAEYSSLIEGNSKINIQTFAEAAESSSEVFASYYSKQVNIDDEALTALNTAYAQDGVFIHVPKNEVVEELTTLYFLTDASKESVVSYPRNLIVVEENAQAKFVEVYKSFGENKSLVNPITEIIVEKYANCEHYKLQNDNINASQLGVIQVNQAKNSLFKQHIYSLRGDIIRNNLNHVLNGEHIESHMNGLYLLDGATHVDNHTVVDHKFPNCESHELYKGIADDSSRGVFNGKIFVREDAQKTNAFQSNRNIVLSDSATVNTKPQLEIWADDVSCSHGCTIGQLDTEAMFYMKSRGIGKKKAKALLMRAFALEVVERISIEPLRIYVEGLIDERLDG